MSAGAFAHRTRFTDNLLQALGSTGEEAHFTGLMAQAGSIAVPSLDVEDPDQRHDWILLPREGIELGFADAAYMAGRPRALWRREGLIFDQITFYSDTREGVSSFTGRLPYGLNLSDTRPVVRAKMAAFESTRRSYRTDRWDIGDRRLVVAYKAGDAGLDSVHVKRPASPYDDRLRRQPVVSAQRWPGLFGHAAAGERLRTALAPLDVQARIVEDGDDREVDFLEECGLMLYFERADRLHAAAGTHSGPRLVLGAAKFFRARDLEARQYTGELPFGLQFDDSPELLAAKMGVQPSRHTDGRTSGRMLWHLSSGSLQVLYSTIENHLFRVMWMAPGYWQDMAAAA